jgi:hypothetical protein
MESIAEVVEETAISSIFRIEDVETVPNRVEGISDFYYGMYEAVFMNLMACIFAGVCILPRCHYSVAIIPTFCV